MPGVRVHFGTLDDFANAIFAENPILPVVKADAPDGWVHGLLSMPQESKIDRNIRPLEPALDALNTQMGIWGISTLPLAGNLAKAYEQSLLFGEHTWGMSAGFGPRFDYGKEWKQWVSEAKAELIAMEKDTTNIGSKAIWLKSYDEHRK